MDLKKAQILLGKVNTLFQSMSADEENIATIEKDLMRSYLQDLYEHFHPAELVQQLNNIASEGSSKTEVKQEKAPPPPPPAPKLKPKPRIIEIPESLKEQVEKPAPAPKAEPISAAPKPKESKKQKSTGFSDDVAALFEQPKPTELSEKLSELPIKDLMKAMGLNERIFTINELFGGDQDAFEGALKQLNGVEEFDDAKGYLMELASNFDWGSKSKAKKARNFIKLIRRRYQK